MNHDEFIKEYNALLEHAVFLSEKGRWTGLLELEDYIDTSKVYNRDVFELGLRFVVDGTDEVFIDKVLSNIIKHERDEYAAILKTIQKEAVLAIQRGINTWLLYCLLNSYTDIPLSEDELDRILKRTFNSQPPEEKT